MLDHNAQGDQETGNGIHRPPSFWKSRTGTVLIGALVIGGLLLGYEHRIHIFGGYSFLWLLLLVCVGMHFFMHGGHGSGGSKS
ncbi:DUF2933 domain-containing protein (plasmid) [Labrenzia sp. 5N]|uniref:DUF2933 domain-containing protein n=1 Tax=Stappiaceae TaxID=2821832 RepID=UPI00094B76F1|nr:MULTISPECIES: DUF2933 domain-containing protein [Stappiaceae]MBO9463324.1 DUF2933 domain-containing protein [Labrenzia sp. R5_0]NKX68184.1 DUF2933 domain-containing protein [Labrenzia sp. 5N]UES53940.1 DUF2933 domain-containing protein [Roseibium aggregatum]UFI06724.1 DUF2933 domain-containing protein [Roseibium aggregatum]